MRSSVTLILSLSLAFAIGCDDERVGTDAGPMTDTGVVPGTDSGPPIDAGPVTDGNDTFATATDITADPAMGRINPANDLDYYRFTGTAGQWVIISTDANPDEELDKVDTVISLFDSSMTQLAENDDAVPRLSPDSEIITRLPADGDYYVLVQEFTTWMDETPEFGLDYTYTLTVAGLNADSPAVTVDAEPGNLAEDAQMIGFNPGDTADFGIIAGVHTDAADVDVFGITGVDARRLLQATLMPPGTDGYGSTVTPARIWITNADGSETIAEIDPGGQDMRQGESEISPSIGDGEYRLWIDHGGTAGTNDFYLFKVYRFEDNPLEVAANEATNNDATGADAITLEDREGIDRGFVLATLGDGDTDHFSFAAEAGDEVTVVCGSRSAGSGVVDLNLTLLDSTGAELTPAATSTETVNDSAIIEDRAITTAGTYIFRITKASQSATVTGNWVRCGVAAGPPPAP